MTRKQESTGEGLRQWALAWKFAAVLHNWKQLGRADFPDIQRSLSFIARPFQNHEPACMVLCRQASTPIMTGSPGSGAAGLGRLAGSPHSQEFPVAEIPGALAAKEQPMMCGWQLPRLRWHHWHCWILEPCVHRDGSDARIGQSLRCHFGFRKCQVTNGKGQPFISDPIPTDCSVNTPKFLSVSPCHGQGGKRCQVRWSAGNWLAACGRLRFVLPGCGRWCQCICAWSGSHDSQPGASHLQVPTVP